MVGFALIIIVVAVILLVFLGLSLRNNSQKDTVESYEVESFIYAALQYTSDCEDNFEALSVQKLISKCYKNEACTLISTGKEKNSCDVLNSTLKEILKESWPIGEKRPVKGYALNISSENNGITSISEGDITSNSKGSFQDFVIAGNTLDISVKVYY